MIADLRDLVRALTAVLHALAIVLKEHVRAQQRKARVEEYNEQVQRVEQAMASKNSDNIGAAWSSIDDSLRAEGISPDLDVRSERDR